MIIKNIHNNKEIIFDEEKHSYTVEGTYYRSVTQNISRFFKPFNMKKISLDYAIKHNLIQNDVIQMWKDNGKEAADFGTFVHKYIECKLLKKKFKDLKTEKEKVYINHINNWFNKFLKYFEIVDVEKIVFIPKFEFAETIDAIFKNIKTRRFVIIDWKTSKEITFENKWQNCINGLEKFDASSYNKFSFQLNTYLKILKDEKYFLFHQKPDLKVIHLTENGLKNINIPILSKKVIDILFDA